MSKKKKISKVTLFRKYSENRENCQPDKIFSAETPGANEIKKYLIIYFFSFNDIPKASKTLDQSVSIFTPECCDLNFLINRGDRKKGGFLFNKGFS